MPEVHSVVKGPKEGWEILADKGAALCAMPDATVFLQAVYSGCYVGFGGLLSMVVAGGLAEASAGNPSLQSFTFAALFPVNLLIIMLTGGVLFTGAVVLVPAAVYEGKASWLAVPRVFAVSWLGNFLGAVSFALVIQYCELNEGPTAELARKIVVKKCSHGFLQTVLKGVGCNWLVSMAVFLSGQAQDMAGKMVGIWFPISCFVACGFEHVCANMFILSQGLLAGADVTVGEALYRNALPATLGNTFAGAVIVAAGYSYVFGRLGGHEPSRPRSRSISPVDVEAQNKDVADGAQC